MGQRFPGLGHRHGHRHGLRPIPALAGVVCGLTLAPMPRALRAEFSPQLQLVAQAPRVSAAFLAEVRRQASQRLQLTPGQVDALLSRLSTMNFSQVNALVVGNGSALRGLIGGLPGPAVAVAVGGSGAQGLLGDSGVATSGGGSAGQQRFDDLRNQRGGFSDGGRGQASAAADCMACANVGNGQENDTDPARDDEAKVINTQSGGKIYLYPDGSFVIQATADRTDQQEVYDKNHRARTGDPRWSSNKTPVPDGEGGQRSGLITAAEWRGLMARVGALGGRERNRSSGAGGMVVTTRTSAGTPVEAATTRVVDVGQLQEILRVAAERFGPRLR